MMHRLDPHNKIYATRKVNNATPNFKIGKGDRSAILPGATREPSEYWWNSTNNYHMGIRICQAEGKSGKSTGIIVWIFCLEQVHDRKGGRYSSIRFAQKENQSESTLTSLGKINRKLGDSNQKNDRAQVKAMTCGNKAGTHEMEETRLNLLV